MTAPALATASETLTGIQLDSTGTQNNGGAAALASNTCSRTFTVGANSDLLVVEVDIRDTTPNTNPGMPATMTFTPAGGGSAITLNQAVVADSGGFSWHNVAIYDAVLTPNSATVSGTVSGVFGTSGNLSAYAMSVFSLSGENTSLEPDTNEADTGSATINQLSLGGVQAGDIAFVIAASGPGQNQAGMTMAATSGAVTTATATTGAGSSQGYPNNNFIMGYVTGLSAGSPTFTATQAGGTGGAGTGGKFVFAVADFDSGTAAYPQRSAAQINALLQPTRTDKSDFEGGVPLGGVGTGTVEWRADGAFRGWQIFNNWGNGYEGGQYVPDLDLLNALAAVNINGTAVVLESSPTQSLPGVSSIAYTGNFPFVNMTYTIPNSPITVSSEGFGIYVPHDVQDSATPAAGLTWTFTNTSSAPVKVSFALSLVNPLGVDCTQVSSSGVTMTQCTRGAEGMAIAALDATPQSILGGADNSSTLTGFWNAFNQATPQTPAANEQGQRFGQMISFTVPANSSLSERFVLGWNFPSHYEGGTGTYVGHQYSNWISSPLDAVTALASNFTTLRTNALAWEQTLGASSWPAWLNYWLVNNQMNLAEFTWWTGSNHFMDYESSDLQNGSPVHITDLANWPVLDAFPSLDLELLTHFGSVQQSNGRIPEQFNGNNGPGITTPNFSRDLIDINPKWVLQIYHRWRETNNAAFLSANYAKAKASILYQAPTALGGLQDNDTLGEGIPNGPNILSTWDHWSDGYTFSYGGSVYLAGVLAMEQMATAQGDTATVTQMQNIYNEGLSSLNSLLWNGEFYAMTTSSTTSNNTVTQTADNISFCESTYGDDFARFIGLTPVLANDRALATLRAIAKYNSPPTPYGVVNTATSDLPDATISSDSGNQLSPGVAAGTMVEYDGDVRDQITTCHDMPPLIALLQQGNATDRATALSLLYNIYSISSLNFSGNSEQVGQLWNMPHHVVAATGAEDVGDFKHYLRDRALYSVIKVLNGWVYDATQQAVTIGPILNPQSCSGPWACSAAFGTLAQNVANNVQTDTMTGRDVNGTLALQHLNILSQVGTVGSAGATLNGQAVASTFTQGNGQVQLTFPSAVSLGNGAALAVTLTGQTPLALTSANSQQTQGNAGTLSLPLNLTGTPTVEPRFGSTKGSYSIVLNFNQPVTALTATLGLQAGQTGTVVGSAQPVVLNAPSSTVTVNLTGVGNKQRLNLQLTGVLPGGNTLNLPFNVLWGDVNGDGVVNILDLVRIRNHSGQVVTSQNCPYDINCDGAINILDLVVTRNLSGTSLP